MGLTYFYRETLSLIMIHPPEQQITTFCSLHALMSAKLICIIVLMSYDISGNSLINLYLFLTGDTNSSPFK